MHIALKAFISNYEHLVLVLCEISRLWLMHSSDTIQYFLYSWLKHASFNHEQKHKVKQENRTAKELSAQRRFFLFVKK